LLFAVAVPHRYTATTQILIDPTDLHAVGSELSPPNQMSDARRADAGPRSRWLPVSALAALVMRCR